MYDSIAPPPSSQLRHDASARHWLTIEDQFFSNKETHAVILDAEFRNFMQ
jgi:hypothetical protein